MPRIVMKFGGTSMAGIERIRSVADACPARGRGGQPGAGRRLGDGWGDRSAGAALPRGGARSTIRPNMTWSSASGEQVTAGLLAMTLQNMGVKARSFMGWQLVRASGVHGNARVEAVEGAMLDEALSGGTVAVIPGFQGVSVDGRLATLGRGGSDTSAVAIAAALKADRCDIYTDVDGVYTTDPRIVPRARKLDQVTFEEMLELAGVGAKVLQVRSVGLAMRENLPLRVLSAFEDKPGTRHRRRAFRRGDGKKPDRRHRRRPQRGADHADRRARQAGDGRASDRPDCRRRHPGRHDRPRGNPEHGLSDLTFTVPRASLAQAMAVIEERASEIGYRELIQDDAVAKVSIVGVGIRSNPQLAAKMFEVLAERQINLLAVSTSEIKVSALIAEAELELAVRVLHTAFGLDAPSEQGRAA